MTARLEDLGFLQHLSDKSRSALVRESRIQTARKNQTLVQQGDVLSHVFLLVDGTLRIYTVNAEGREATLYCLRAGDVCLLSLNAAFSNGRYPAWVTVESKTASIALLPARKIRTLFTDEKAVQDVVLESLTTTVRELMVHLDEVLTCRLTERIERYLLRNCDRHGRVNITHQDLATHLGVMREAVSREIAALRRQKKITSGRGYFQILSK